MVINIRGIKSSVNGGIPMIEIHLPPNCLCIGRFNLSAIRYILGTITNVIKKAKVNPNIIVQARGFQKEALSPPKKICTCLDHGFFRFHSSSSQFISEVNYKDGIFYYNTSQAYNSDSSHNNGYTHTCDGKS